MGVLIEHEEYSHLTSATSKCCARSMQNNTYQAQGMMQCNSRSGRRKAVYASTALGIYRTTGILMRTCSGNRTEQNQQC